MNMRFNRSVNNDNILVLTSFNSVTTVFVLGACQTPGYALSIHSSKVLLVSQVAAPPYTLADSIIQLAVAKGRRHDVGCYSLVNASS